MEDFLPPKYLLIPPIHPSPDSTITVPIPDTSMLPRPKKTRRGKYDPERDYSADCRRRVYQSPKAKRTARACDRCKCRKLPCDENEESCNNCVKQGTQCNMTDTSTGKTYPRNILIKMAQQIFKLEDQVREKNREIQGLKQKIENLLHLHHQSPGIQPKNLNLSEHHHHQQPSQGMGSTVHSHSEGTNPQQLLVQVQGQGQDQGPDMSGQDLV